jgi:hypothetical protein
MDGGARTEAQEQMEIIPVRQQVGDHPLAADQLRSTVAEVLAKTPFIDVHTHLFPPSFGGLGLWGIDELLTYHYLEAELFRSSNISPEFYWSLPKREQANAIWQALFVESSPVVREKKRNPALGR